MVIGDLGEQLDEIKRPSLGFRFWTIAQSIKPRLEFVEEQCGWLRLKHLKKQVDAGHVGFGIAFAKPFSFDELALRMAVKQDVPQELESLLMEAFSDDEKICAELESFQFRAV